MFDKAIICVTVTFCLFQWISGNNKQNIKQPTKINEISAAEQHISQRPSLVLYYNFRQMDSKQILSILTHPTQVAGSHFALNRALTNFFQIH